MKRRFIPITEPALIGREGELVAQCIEAGWISSASGMVSEFETAFACEFGMAYGCATPSGTTALHLALALLKVGPGDEVIVPDFAMAAVANAVLYCNATPVAVDVEPEYGNLCPDAVAAAIGRRTRAIIVVHTYGHPAEMTPILAEARKHGIPIIEDCAEAIGAEYRGKRVGGIGDLSIFSFYANKIITTGEGGMVLCRTKKQLAELRRLQNHYFTEPRFYHRAVGYSYKMTGLQAAVGLGQLEYLQPFIDKRRENACLYEKYLDGIPGLVMTQEADWARNVYWMICARCLSTFGMSRNRVMKELAGRGIDSRRFFYGLHQQPAYRKRVRFKGRYPVTTRLSRQGLNLPTMYGMTEAEIRFISNALRDMAQS